MIRRYVNSSIVKNKNVVILTDSQLFKEVIKFFCGKHIDKIVFLEKFDYLVKRKTIYFVASIYNLENICKLLRSRKFEEGKNFYCLRPIVFPSVLKSNEWEQIEYFQPTWEARSKEMLKLLPENCNGVIDLGCGECKVRNNLMPGVRYIGVDYKKRNEETILADFNKGEFPVIQNNSEDNYVYFCSGCMEYVENVDWFLKCMADGKTLILSYCSLEHNRDMKKRRKLAWKNHCTVLEIVCKMKKFGYVCEKSSYYNGNVLFRFEPKKSIGLIDGK